MIGEELSAESELGQQSVSLCDDSGNNSVFFHEAQGNLLKGITLFLWDINEQKNCQSF